MADAVLWCTTAQAHLLGADGILPLDQVQQMTAAYHEGSLVCILLPFPAPLVAGRVWRGHRTGFAHYAIVPHTSHAGCSAPLRTSCRLLCSVADAVFSLAVMSQVYPHGELRNPRYKPHGKPTDFLHGSLMPEQWQRIAPW
jgi:hypothetical protein